MRILIFSTCVSFGFPGSYGTISSQKGNYRRFMGSGLTAFFTCMSLHFPAPILIVSAHGWAIICCEYDKCWKVRLAGQFCHLAFLEPCVGPKMVPKLRGENIDTQVLPLSICAYLHHIIAFPWAETIRIGTGKWSDTQEEKFKILSVETSWISYNFLFGWKWCQMSSETQMTCKWKYSKL